MKIIKTMSKIEKASNFTTIPLIKDQIDFKINLSMIKKKRYGKQVDLVSIMIVLMT